MSQNRYFNASSRLPRKADSGYLLVEEGVELPLIPLPGVVLHPNNSIPLSSLAGLKAADIKAAEKGRLRLAVITVPPGEPDQVDWTRVGTVAEVTGLLRLPSGETGAVIKGQKRFLLRGVTKRRFGWQARVDIVGDRPVKRTKPYIGTTRALKAAIARLLRANSEISDDTRQALEASDDPGLLCDYIVPHLSLTLEERLACLGEFNLRQRMQLVLAHLTREMDLIKLSDAIHDQVKGDLHEEHRRYYLREQIVAIKRELGEMDGWDSASEKLDEALAKLELSGLAREAVDEELERLGMLSPGTSEYMVGHSYLSLIKDLPWSGEAPKPPRLAQAKAILAKRHFGLEPVKEKILEYLAVVQHRGAIPGQILLLNGPPGVGKTSLARSIAEALGRPFARVSLGGVKDEGEIRGHRRTYIGSMPGKIIQALKQTGSRHPVILLDEIDKVGGGQESAIAAALLEVLDREQNHEFVDHYLALPFDLSGVVFIATSNDAQKIPEPLRDRMETVDVSSYTDQEKLEIAKRHIVPAIRRAMNLTARQFRLADRTLMAIMRGYTREAGVRQFERELTTLGRKVVKRLVESRRNTRLPLITPETLVSWLGSPRFLDEPNDAVLTPGVAIGLAYTDVGGEILYVEASRLEAGREGGRLTMTGSLGKVMRESAQAVWSYLASQASALGLDADQILRSQFHLHFPDGGTPKDGPSAGTAILTAMASVLTGRAVPAKLAMTGEITLRGQVLAVGGIREKVLAAHRYGKTTVLLPAANESDLRDVPADVLNRMTIVPVRTMTEVLAYAGLLAPAEHQSGLVEVRSEAARGLIN